MTQDGFIYNLNGLKDRYSTLSAYAGEESSWNYGILYWNYCTRLNPLTLVLTLDEEQKNDVEALEYDKEIYAILESRYPKEFSDIIVAAGSKYAPTAEKIRNTTVDGFEGLRLTHSSETECFDSKAEPGMNFSFVSEIMCDPSINYWIPNIDYLTVSYSNCTYTLQQVYGHAAACPVY